jgi:polyisoprenoid-binding protein YceI
MHLTVYTSSIDTKDTEHDAMLRASDFFDVQRFPTMRFVSTSAVVGPDGRLLVTGDLTIRDITKRVAVPVDVTPAGPGGDANPRLDTTFEIDRTEFGLNGLPKWGGLSVSVAKNVKIHLAIATTTTGVR